MPSDEVGCKCGCGLGRIFGMRRLRRLCRLLRGSLHRRRMSRRHMPWLQNLYITYSLVSLFSFWLIHFLIPCFAVIHSVLFVLFVVACDCQSLFLLRFEHMPSPNPHTSKSLLLSLSPSLSVFLSLSLFLSLCLPLGPPFSCHSKLAVSPTLHHLPSVRLGVPSLLYPVCGIVWGIVELVRLSLTLSVFHTPNFPMFALALSHSLFNEHSQTSVTLSAWNLRNIRVGITDLTGSTRFELFFSKNIKILAPEDVALILISTSFHDNIKVELSPCQDEAVTKLKELLTTTN